MKRFFGVALVGGILAGTVSAAPVGWINPQMGKFSVSGEVGKITSRDFKRASGGTTTGEYESLYYTGRLAYGLTEQVELYGRLGAADLDAEAGSTVGTGSGGSELSWGAGGQGILYDAGSWNLGGDAQYNAHNDHSGYSTTGTRAADYSEWQLGVQVQGQFEEFFPYIGVKYSDATVEVSGLNDDEADDNVGIYGGAGFNLTPQLSGYVEGQFVDNTMFGAGLRYTF